MLVAGATVRERLDDVLVWAVRALREPGARPPAQCHGCLELVVAHV